MTQHILTAKTSASPRIRSIKRILWMVLAFNLFVAVAKYLYGTISGSAAMQADGIHSVFDSAGNIIGLIGIVLAARPADTSHPYGHAKFETYASIGIGLLLVFAAYEVGSTAIGKIVSQDFNIEVTPVSFIVMIVTLCINLFVTWYERKKGKELNSEVLIADASHTLSDALVSIGVIVGLVLVLLGYPVADPIMALIVMVAILFTAYGVFRQALSTLSDKARIPEEEIRSLVMLVPEIKNAHRIRTRGTEGEVYADLHILVSPEMTVARAHDLSEIIEDAIKKEYPIVKEVLVHIEPDDGHIE